MRIVYTASLRNSRLVRATAADREAKGVGVPEDLLVRYVCGPICEAEVRS